MDFSLTEPTLKIAKALFPDGASEAVQEAAEITRQHQQEANNLKFQTDYKIHKEREQEYNDVMNQVFSLIMTMFCSKTMVHRIEQHPEYKTKIQDDPIDLLEAIKTLIHDPIRAQHPIISAHTAQKLWYTTRYTRKESKSTMTL